MISIRLPGDLEKKLNEIAEQNNTSKSAIIKDALNMYLEKNYHDQNPYELGKDLFGKYSSNNGTLSQNYKYLIKKKLHDKNAH
ncbi:MAG TPA: ribbon-helix-helix domain-containing protein [Spirochaetota bacterium]|nr:ribbon-helix-helix domain-containing protein [Spirochaetota bacterium]HPI90305.1 ribbon-helix-helix domain-containing protein [Spirochaetota bacterium]HPR49305.1 ribbon-helix-helix domain-containing protein [Spirochaetota bacterium]